ncbi:hypothetical protein Golax_012939, partial [Gossypium laxum]|nr:hypothetical protein [Gossypium laxum]
MLYANPTSSPDDYMVVAIFSVDHHTTYIRPSRDKEWTYVHQNWGVLHNLIYYQDRFCAVNH